jgi:multidrug resistance efflux pump
MQVRFRDGRERSDNGNGNGNGNGYRASGPAWLRVIKRWRSRARCRRDWTWAELSIRQRRLIQAAAGILVIALVIALWPARGFTAHGVVTAQELLLNAESDLTVTDCYVRVGDRVKAGDPLYVTVNGDPRGELAELDDTMATLRLRLLGLEATEAASAPALADDAERLNQASAALATTRDALAALPEAPDLTALRLRLDSATAAVDARMEAHRRSQLQLGEMERMRALDATPIGDLRSAQDRESERYQALQEALLAKRELEAERDRLVAEHALRRSALEDQLRREEAHAQATSERLLRRRDGLMADLREEIETQRARRERLLTAHAPRTRLAPASCVIREISVADGTALVAGAPIMRIDLDDRLQIRAYVPSSQRSELASVQRAWIFPDDDGRIGGSVTARAQVALPIPPEVRQRIDSDDTKALLVVIEPEHSHELIPGEVVRLRVW